MTAIPAYTTMEVLRELRRVAETLPEENLEMENWGNIADNDYEVIGAIEGDSDNKAVSVKEFNCGTSLCLLGHAFSTPWFNERGFYMAASKGEIDDVDGYGVIDVFPTNIKGGDVRPSMALFNSNDFNHKIQRPLGINKGMFDFLFMHTSNDRDELIARIDVAIEMAEELLKLPIGKRSFDDEDAEVRLLKRRPATEGEDWS